MGNMNWNRETLSSFCLEYSLLLKAGIPAEECFSVLTEQEQEEKKIALFQALYEKMILGMSLSDAMTEAEVFPAYFLKMVHLGEETGNLEETFRALSVYYKERQRMIQSLKEAMLFPIVLLIVMLIVVVVLLIQVLPVFQNVFAQLGSTLPPFSMALMQFGMFLQKGRYFFLIVAVAILCVGAVFFISERKREKLFRFWNHKFQRTKIGRFYGQANFASALAMAVSSGQDLDQSLKLAESFCADTGLEKNIALCRKATTEGMPLAEAVKQEGLLQPMYCQMLSIGIRTGELDTTLSEISRRSEEEAENALAETVSKVEPTVVILLSVIVGILLLSVMIPLAGVLSSFGG